MSDATVHRAERAEERGEGICRTCLAPIWNEGGTIGGHRWEEGWSDRIERGGDSLVCFKARDYRHVPLAGREACIYDAAYKVGRVAGGGFSSAALLTLADRIESERIGDEIDDWNIALMKAAEIVRLVAEGGGRP